MESWRLVCRWRQTPGFRWQHNFSSVPARNGRWASIIFAMPQCSLTGAFPASCSAQETSPMRTRLTNGFRSNLWNAPRHFCSAFCNPLLEPDRRFAVQSSMFAAKGQIIQMTQATHRAAFFRQSGWMMFATVAGGVFMYAVHMIAKQMPKEEYGVFTTLLQIVTLMGIPAIGLQSVFAQQAAAAMTEDHERALAGVLRGVLRAIFFIWLAMAFIVFVFRQQVLEGLKIANPAALAITVVIGLAAMWYPIMMGLLQGRQNFLWLGWASIFNGVGRFAAICVIVLFLGGYAAGGMIAVFLGLMTAVALGGWLNRDYWQIKPSHVVWREWLGRVVPLTLGLGAAMFMLSADMVFVQRFFSKEQTGYYAAAGMIGRALVFFTLPLTAVMFPKVVKSAARAEKTDVLLHALGVTALAGGAAALGCTVFPSL